MRRKVKHSALSSLFNLVETIHFDFVIEKRKDWYNVIKINMPETIRVLIIVFASLAGVYILFFFVVFIFFSNFKKHLYDRQHALNLLFQQRKDVLFTIVDLAQKEKIVFDASLLKQVKKMRKDDDKNIQSEHLLEHFAKLEKVSSDVNVTLKNDKTFKKKEEFILFQKEIEEIDDLKRQNISIYNHDVEGYNYWVRFLGYRYIFVLFKVEQKKRLE